LKAISGEQLRILVAAAQGSLVLTNDLRYVIAGEERPDRRERERLMKRGMLERVWCGPVSLTPKGIEALRAALLADPEAQTSLNLTPQPDQEAHEASR